MEVDQLITAKAQVKYQSTKHVIASIQRTVHQVGQSILDGDKIEFVVNKKNIVMAVWDISSLYNNSKSNNNNNTEFDQFFIIGGFRNSSSYIDISNKEPKLTSSMQSIINIPNSVIYKHKHSYISSVNYQNSRLFMNNMRLKEVLGNTDEAFYFDWTTKTSQQPYLVVQSNVFDVSLGNQSISDLDELIGVRFRNAAPQFSTPISGASSGDDTTCKFWKFVTGRFYWIFMMFVQFWNENDSVESFYFNYLLILVFLLTSFRIPKLRRVTVIGQWRGAPGPKETRMVSYHVSVTI